MGLEGFLTGFQGCRRNKNDRRDSLGSEADAVSGYRELKVDAGSPQ